jgi:hypothetical protein
MRPRAGVDANIVAYAIRNELVGFFDLREKVKRILPSLFP